MSHKKREPFNLFYAKPETKVVGNTDTLGRKDTVMSEVEPSIVHQPRGWEAMSSFHREAWMARANRLVAILVPVFTPKIVSLKYECEDQARLTLLQPTGDGAVEVGVVNLER